MALHRARPGACRPRVAGERCRLRRRRRSRSSTSTTIANRPSPVDARRRPPVARRQREAATRRARRRARGAHMRAGTVMPSRPRPVLSVAAVSAHSASRERRGLARRRLRAPGTPRRTSCTRRRARRGRCRAGAARASSSTSASTSANPESLTTSARSGGSASTVTVARALARPRADRRGAHVRVEQVRRGVAVEREHAVEAEDEVALAAGGEVGVLDRADPDRVRRSRARSASGSSGLLASTTARARVDRVVEQVRRARTVPPERVLNGLPSSPSIVPNADVLGVRASPASRRARPPSKTIGSAGPGGASVT